MLGKCGQVQSVDGGGEEAGRTALIPTKRVASDFDQWHH